MNRIKINNLFYFLDKTTLNRLLYNAFLTKFSRPLIQIGTIFHFPALYCNHCNSSNDVDFLNFTNKLYKHPGSGHNVLLIQPKVRQESKNELELKMSEAASLVNTLPNWTVLNMHIVNVTSLKSKLLFGTGNIDKLKKIVKENHSLTAIFIAIDILTAAQNSKLEKIFKVQVFDRYQIILQIFHDHAFTREAKLQLSLAEIPYLRVKLAGYHHTGDSSTFAEIVHVGGSGETFMETRRRLLDEREIKLKKQLEKIKNQRDFLRNNSMRKSIPIIAVVGYTNSGKTTLIKSLTNDQTMSPEDKLFATLDVTLHAGFLPSNQKVLFIDTVGFISNVPTKLILSFRSTLEEINLADLVVHVRDISHPDTENQRKTVLATLQSLDLPEKLVSSIVEVKNKMDLVNQLENMNKEDELYISAKHGTGLQYLLKCMEEKLFENTGHSSVLLRIPNGGEEYSWLLKNGAIHEAIADETNENYLLVEAVLSLVNMAKFKHIFGDCSIKLKNVTNKS